MVDSRGYGGEKEERGLASSKYCGNKRVTCSHRPTNAEVCLGSMHAPISSHFRSSRFPEIWPHLLAMSHPNFAALPEGVRSSAALRGDTEARSWRARLGVSQQVSALNLVSFLIHAAASICFLVFLNASQPFIIAQLGVTEGQGALSG